MAAPSPESSSSCPRYTIVEQSSAEPSANATAAQAIGYKELFPYLRGEEDLETSVARLKQATRRYAKRQMTWFSAKPYVKWIEVDDGAGKNRAFEDLLQEALALFREDKP